MLVIDTQKGIYDNRLYAFDDFVTNVKQLEHITEKSSIFAMMIKWTFFNKGQRSL